MSNKEVVIYADMSESDWLLIEEAELAELGKLALEYKQYIEAHGMIVPTKMHLVVRVNGIEVHRIQPFL